MQYGLTKGLPIVPVRIGVSQPHREFLERSMERVPSDLILRAWIDTGASVTLVDNAQIRRLCLPDRGVCNVRGFDGNLHASPETKVYLNYDISFAVMDPTGKQEVVVSSALQAVGADLGHPDFDVLLGLDILKQCTLFMDLSSNHFDVAPSSPYPVVI
jgi:hypothetical protein